MKDPRDIAQRVLSMLPGGVDGSVTASAEQSGLTRFANSFIHQNVAEEGTSVSLTVESSRRVTTATAKVADPEMLAGFVNDTVEAVKIAPINDEWPGFVEPTPVVAPTRSQTHVTAPADRAQRVEAFVQAAPDLRAAGYCQTGVAEVAHANTLDHQVVGHRASAILDGIHQTPTSAGSGHAAGHSIAELDGSAVGALAADRARRGLGPSDVAPGEYEVVLAPEAVATIVTFLGFYGFNSKAVAEDQSFVKVGEQQFDRSFGLVDDATDARALGLPFDNEGTPKRPLVMVEEGVSKALAVDRRQGAKLGLESTGHAALFFGGYFGALATNVFVTPGESTPEELIAGVERGLYVSTFNYVRILDPRTSVATGLTRNGTFLIEDGKLAGAVSNLRFTQSFAGALAPGRILGIGNDARLADGEFGPGMVHAPSMRLAAWRFTGGAEG